MATTRHDMSEEAISIRRAHILSGITEDNMFARMHQLVSIGANHAEAYRLVSAQVASLRVSQDEQGL